MPTENNIIVSIIAAAVGGLVTFFAIRVFTKSEDSASKEYVDVKCEKLDEKIQQKVDKIDFQAAIQRIEAKQDKILDILLERR